MLTRRQFLSLGALAAAGAGCSSARAGESAYSVLVLGDVHFDAPEIGVYHAHYKPKPGSTAACKFFRLKTGMTMTAWRRQHLG